MNLHSFTKRSERDIMAPWLAELQKHRRFTLPGMLLMLLTAIAGIALLAISGWFIVGAGITGALLAAGAWVYFDIYIAGAAIRVLALLRTVGRYGERVINHDAVLRLQQQWRVQVFTQIVRQPSRFVSQLRSADLSQRLTHDLSTLDALYLRIKAPSVVAIIMLIAVLVAVYWVYQSTYILILSLVCYGAALLGGIWGARYLSKKPGRREQYYYQRVREHGQNYVEGLAELDAAQAAAATQQDVIQVGDALTQAQANRLKQQRMLSSWVSLWSGVVVILLLGVGASLVEQGQVSGPQVALLVFAALAYGELIQSLPEQNGHWGAVLQASEQLNTVTTRERDEPEVVHNAELVSAMAWEHIDVQLRGKVIFSNLSMQVQRGEHLALLAPSGVGKSLLISLLLGLHYPDRGLVCLGYESAHWKTKLGVIEQDSRVLAGSLAENLRIVKPHATDSQLWDALEFAELAETVKNMPDQLQTLAGAGGFRLSGGQARRLQLARLYLQDPECVILDEPFTGLDRATQNTLKQRLETWLASKTCFMVAHSADALPPAEAYYTLIKGKAERLKT
ncbi:amino acid ABC transporter ATP-binding/permease protein [Aliidiomarina indica]|uniref:amino acid ABC transporter ATP-binding/permease protein n=1 Tax=Aliidiomarina indica TaxID=2749147 RepID=UPI00188E2FBE|nr:ATP-binding cassette domain-containing protein [Aliidiomarina indica]